MQSLNRFEMIGIGASIAVAILVLGGVRLYQGSENAPRVVDEATDTGVVVVDPTAADADSALARAIVAGSSDRGRVTKLIVQDVAAGAGRAARAGDTVTVHYIGLVKDGQQFENTYTTNAPYTFKLGTGAVIEGWDRGIVGMEEGGQRILVVPATLGYGPRAVGPIPANATLIFALELISIE